MMRGLAVPLLVGTPLAALAWEVQAAEVAGPACAGEAGGCPADEESGLLQVQAAGQPARRPGSAADEGAPAPLNGTRQSAQLGVQGGPGSGKVAGSWRIAGGGPDHPENTGITFTMGVTKTASDTQATKISNAMKAESSFYGIKVSDEFKADWESTVMQSVTQTTTVSCTQSCPADYYLWVFKTQVTVPDDGLPYYLQDFAASCEAAICSPFGLAKPPRCPFGYQDDQDDQKGGFQCCASNAWATPGATGLPPICPGD